MAKAPPLIYSLFQSTVVATSTISVAYYFYPQKLYGFLFDLSDNAITPLLRKMDPEVSHRLSVAFSRSMFRLKDLDPDDPSLSTTVMGLKFSNPLGLAAGFDKHGDAIGGGLDLGFAFVEVGSVTPKEQPGNPYPRVFRLPEDRAVINRYGFNSHGLDRVANNMIDFQNYRECYRRGLVGVNAGKNKDTTEEEAHNDYTSVIERLGPQADYVVINVSSPNTPGLRDLQRTESMSRIILACSEARDRALLARSNTAATLPKQITPPAPLLPLLVKISPDLSREEKECIARLLLSLHSQGKIDGMIVSNTTTSRPASLLSTEAAKETGGLSGAPLKDLSTRLIGEMFVLTEGKIPIIGVGGVATGQDAYEKIVAGASLVQMYTMLAYEGPGAVRRAKRDLKKILQSKGYDSVGEAVGARFKPKIATGNKDNAPKTD